MRGFPLPILLPLLLAGCGMADSRDVELSRTSLIGLTRADLYVCAGFPTKRERIDVVREMLSYELKSGQGGGLNLTLPVVGDLTVTGSGHYCHATFELIDARVTRVGFAGDKDIPGAPGAYCAPLIRECLRPVGAATSPPAE
ncbi:hypothetical protein [Teichococcus aestuarii]|uniref:Lipoprotein n=1 Tax=Teichococcus aestuarii TaxID=568898 RepID=A0A2U1V1J1_9PROT|nr:hypothetical protein [Pseudoroseomonas aestuarii]PWC27777.1 hypothetical protein CR165_15885 [Pseudoroseomonas aestuarii]